MGARYANAPKKAALEIRFKDIGTNACSQLLFASAAG